MHGEAALWSPGKIWPLEDQMDKQGRPQQLNAKHLLINRDHMLGLLQVSVLKGQL